MSTDHGTVPSSPLMADEQFIRAAARRFVRRHSDRRLRRMWRRLYRDPRDVRLTLAWVGVLGFVAWSFCWGVATSLGLPTWVTFVPAALPAVWMFLLSRRHGPSSARDQVLAAELLAATESDVLRAGLEPPTTLLTALGLARQPAPLPPAELSARWTERFLVDASPELAEVDPGRVRTFDEYVDVVRQVVSDEELVALASADEVICSAAITLLEDLARHLRRWGVRVTFFVYPPSDVSSADYVARAVELLPGPATPAGAARILALAAGFHLTSGEVAELVGGADRLSRLSRRGLLDRSSGMPGWLGKVLSPFRFRRELSRRRHLAASKLADLTLALDEEAASVDADAAARAARDLREFTASRDLPYHLASHPRFRHVFEDR